MTAPKDKRTTAHAALNVGNNIDLMARFNAPDYSPWNILKAKHVSSPAPCLAAVLHALREKATRTNPYSPVCELSG